MTVGIIGAGISGLTLAYELQRRNVAYWLCEASARPGGYIQTSHVGPYRVEHGPNSLLGDAQLLDWLDGLGLTPDLRFARPVSKARYIFRDGAYRPLPSGPPSLLFGPFFSWKSKWAVLREWRNRTTTFPGETVAQFFRRRFSAEILDYAVGPFVAGIYAGDPEELLVADTFPILLQYEKEYGSVLRGFVKSAGGAGRRQSFSFADGMQQLPDTLAATLKYLHLNRPITALDRSETGWLAHTPAGPLAADHVVLAMDTHVAAQLLRPHHGPLAEALDAVTYPPMTAVHSVYNRADVAHPLNGFGGLNPAREGRFAAGHIWNSSIFPDCAPPDAVLFTTFVGGQQNPDNARQPDEIILARVHAELAGAFGISVPAPHWRNVVRWPRAIPQYDARRAAAMHYVPDLAPQHLHVLANWSGGVSLSDCIKGAWALAKTFSA